MIGREVLKLISSPAPNGVHNFEVDAFDLPNGVYIYRLEIPTGSTPRSMVVLR